MAWCVSPARPRSRNRGRRAGDPAGLSGTIGSVRELRQPQKTHCQFGTSGFNATIEGLTDCNMTDRPEFPDRFGPPHAAAPSRPRRAGCRRGSRRQPGAGAGPDASAPDGADPPFRFRPDLRFRHPLGEDAEILAADALSADRPDHRIGNPALRADRRLRAAGRRCRPTSGCGSATATRRWSRCASG